MKTRWKALAGYVGAMSLGAFLAALQSGATLKSASLTAGIVGAGTVATFFAPPTKPAGGPDAN